MNNKERAAHWHHNINQWKESGLSGAQFCKLHELDLSQFYYWKSKSVTNSSKAILDPKHQAGFSRVVVTDSSPVSYSQMWCMEHQAASCSTRIPSLN